MGKARTKLGGFLYTASIVVHVGLAVGVSTLKRSEAHKAVAISMTETKKAKAAEKPAEPPPPPPPPPEHKAAPQRAAARAPATPAAVNPAPAAASPGLGALPDFGLSMSGGSSGLAVAAARSAAAEDRPAKTVAAPKALAQAAQVDECSEPAKKPKALSVPQPSFTKDAQEAGISGKVRVEVSVDGEGNVASVRVLQGLGHGLDEAALEAVRGARFEAATRCGKAVSATFVISIRFDPP